MFGTKLYKKNLVCKSELIMSGPENQGPAFAGRSTFVTQTSFLSPHLPNSVQKTFTFFWPDRMVEHNYYLFKTHYLQAFCVEPIKKALKEK